jgi:hypothetical protein
VVVGFAPVGKAFPGGPQEPGSCLMKKRIHEPRSEKLKSEVSGQRSEVRHQRSEGGSQTTGTGMVY